MASGSGRPVRGPHPRDITSQTRTPAGPGAAVTAEFIRIDIRDMQFCISQLRYWDWAK
jgi:hypothetical protein